MNTNDVCCPKFNPKLLDNKTHKWKNKLFLKSEVVQFLHIPLNVGSVITKMWKKVEAAGAGSKAEDFLILFYDPSPWKSEVYMTVEKEIPGENMAKLSGTFYSRVFDGPYNEVPKWLTEMEKSLKAKKQKVSRYYIHYTYCPKCAKKYGHNYGVVFAKVN